ncbi:MAG: Ku protein [Pelosinus sp.]|nr:Ku protein [Pelosinus sp.]
MARPMWNGSISFGLVNIPIKLFNAVKRKTLHFNQLRKSDGCRIRLKKTCQNDGQEVANEDIVKGYEISPDRYVIVSAADLEALQPKTSRIIEIETFIHLDEIHPILYDQSYYLVPDKGAVKPYSLLFAAMQESKKVAIAKFTLRNKEYLAAIHPVGHALTLSTMFFANEIVDQTELEDLPSAETAVAKKELAIAMQLIDSLSSNFVHESYHDEYREKALAMIEKKAEGQEIVEQKAEAVPQKGKVIDLMDALEASLTALKKKPAAKERRKKARAQ